MGLSINDVIIFWGYPDLPPSSYHILATPPPPPLSSRHILASPPCHHAIFWLPSPPLHPMSSCQFLDTPIPIPIMSFCHDLPTVSLSLSLDGWMDGWMDLIFLWRFFKKNISKCSAVGSFQTWIQDLSAPHKAEDHPQAGLSLNNVWNIGQSRWRGLSAITASQSRSIQPNNAVLSS